MNNTPNKQEEIEKETQEILNNPEIMKEIRKQRERERTGDYSDFIPLKDLFIKEDKEIFALGNAMEDYKKECISLKRQLENTSSALHLKINRLQDHAKEDYDKGFYKGIKEGKAQAISEFKEKIKREIDLLPVTRKNNIPYQREEVALILTGMKSWVREIIEKTAQEILSQTEQSEKTELKGQPLSKSDSPPKEITK